MKITRGTYKFVAMLCLCIFLCGGGDALARKKKKEHDEAAELEASVKREISIGNKVAEEIAKHMDFIEDPVYTARVRGIFNRLTPYVQRPLPYNVHIIKEKSPNAFCIPGGNIYVTTGLLEFARSDSELAFVIAHELSHANGKHVIIQMERNQRLSLAALAIAIASRGAGAAVVLSNVAAISIASAYSRDLEQEADYGAITIAENAGYDLIAGVTTMERLAAEELKQPWYDPGITLDHPKISERIQYIADEIERRGYRIHRKDVLKLLIPRILEENGELIFKIDDTEILRGPSSFEMKRYLENAADVVRKSLLMETPVYDIQVIKYGEDLVLSIGPSRFMAEPIPGGKASLDQVRERVLDALTKARRKHPMANYNL